MLTILASPSSLHENVFLTCLPIQGLFLQAEQGLNLAPGSFDLAISLPLTNNIVPVASYTEFKEYMDIYLDNPSLKLDNEGRTLVSFLVSLKQNPLTGDVASPLPDVPNPLPSHSYGGSTRPARLLNHKRNVPSSMKRCTRFPVLSMLDSLPSPSNDFSLCLGCSSFGPKVAASHGRPLSCGQPVHPGNQAASASIATREPAPNAEGTTIPPSSALSTVGIGLSAKAECHSLRETIPTLDTIRERRRNYVRAVNRAVARKLAGAGMVGLHRHHPATRTMPALLGVGGIVDKPSSPGLNHPSFQNQVPRQEDSIHQRSSLTTEVFQDYIQPFNIHPKYFNPNDAKITKHSGIYHMLVSQAFYDNPEYVVFAQVCSGITAIEVYHPGDDIRNRPVVILQCGPPEILSGETSRNLANEYIQHQFTDVACHTNLPRIHGISLCGDQARLYMLDQVKGVILPRRDSTPDPDHVSPRQYLDSAWNCNLTMSTGMETFKSVITDVQMMSEGLTQAQAQALLHPMTQLADHLLRPGTCVASDENIHSSSKVTLPMPGAFNMESLLVDNAARTSHPTTIPTPLDGQMWPTQLFHLSYFNLNCYNGHLLTSIGNLNHLLFSLFAPLGLVVCPFDVLSDSSPRLQSTLRYLVKDSQDRSVFLAQFSSNLNNAQQRSEADDSMCQFFNCSWTTCALSKLHAISMVSGDSIRFYTLDTATRVITPTAVASASIDHVIPQSYLNHAWDHQLTSQERFKKFKEVISDCIITSISAEPMICHELSQASIAH